MFIALATLLIMSQLVLHSTTSLPSAAEKTEFLLSAQPTLNCLGFNYSTEIKDMSNVLYVGDLLR